MSHAIIDAKLRVEGLIEVTGDLAVEGRVDGRLSGDGHITIAAGASCRASIRCPRLTIVGELIGNAVCTESIDVAPGARVVGDLRAPDVQVGANAEVDGRVDVLAPEPMEASVERRSVGSRGPGPVRPEPPEFARTIPSPPRPSGRLSLSRSKDTSLLHRGGEE